MCTGIAIKSLQNNYFWGRTMEFEFEQPYNILAIPRNYTIDAYEKPIKVKYATMGIATYHLPVLTDGVNEHGLAGGMFYFPGYNNYADAAAIEASGKRAAVAEEVVTYILTTYKDVAEIKARVNSDLAVANTPNAIGTISPLHYVFQDTTGASVVLETSTPGVFEIFDNPIGVFTNRPKFDWHLTNLQNYVGLHDTVEKDLDVAALHVLSSGKGSGLYGLPGDFTTQSRFVRATFLKEFLEPVDDAASINGLFHVLNSFDIGKGYIVSEGAETVHHTQYTCGYDLCARTIYFHTYQNMDIQRCVFTEAMMSAPDLQYFTMAQEQQYRDVVAR